MTNTESLNMVINPIISAVHNCGIYSSACTKNFKWLFTGGEDGFIRKYDIIASLNGESNLTGAQRHGLPDSITKGALLVSAWENEDGIAKSSNPEEPDTSKISAVYSLDVESKGVWAVSGTESGAINLWSVRHNEGKLQTTLKSHKGPVSSLRIAPGERSLASGSWDKTVKCWSLEDGSIIQQFDDFNTQLTSIAYSPDTSSQPNEANGAENSMLLANCFDGSTFIYDCRKPNGLIHKITAASLGSTPWSLSACWSTNGDKIYVGRRNAIVDEIDVRQGTLIRQLKLPHGSGNVSSVLAVSDDRHLLIASQDNVRMWDLEHSSSTENPTVSGLAQRTREPSVELPLHNDQQNDLFPLLGEHESKHQDPFSLNFFDRVSPSPEKVLKSKQELLELELLEMAKVPFNIISGHRGGVISSMLWTDSYLVTTSGNRGWEGNSTNMCLLYEVNHEL
ncbi:WD40-repeat-containing domain protein [Globomyces pollinis-pini]|nr:WD40-repeat-containing domain protein [Globomyces pollinis-pini]